MFHNILEDSPQGMERVRRCEKLILLLLVLIAKQKAEFWSLTEKLVNEPSENYGPSVPPRVLIVAEEVSKSCGGSRSLGVDFMGHFLDKRYSQHRLAFSRIAVKPEDPAVLGVQPMRKGWVRQDPRTGIVQELIPLIENFLHVIHRIGDEKSIQCSEVSVVLDNL